MTHVTGTIQAPAAVSSHSDPATTNGGDWQSGGTPTLTISGFTNTGNVPLQCGDILTSNEVNCTVTSTKFVVAGVPVEDTTITVEPNESVSVQAQLQLDTPPPGSNEEFSFDLVVSWN